MACAKLIVLTIISEEAARATVTVKGDASSNTWIRQALASNFSANFCKELSIACVSGVPHALVYGHFRVAQPCCIWAEWSGEKADGIRHWWLCDRSKDWSAAEVGCGRGSSEEALYVRACCLGCRCYFGLLASTWRRLCLDGCPRLRWASVTVFVVFAWFAWFATGWISHGGEPVAVFALRCPQADAGLESGYSIGH